MPRYVFSKGKLKVQEGIYTPVRDKAKRLTGAGVLILISAFLSYSPNSTKESSVKENTNDQHQ